MPIYGMRRGTPAAEHFGAYLRETRLKKNMTLQQVADYLGVFPATPSQVELGRRVIKPDDIGTWASAYRMGPVSLRKAYREIYNTYPVTPIFRSRSTAISAQTLEQMIKKLTSAERSRIQGYIEAIFQERGN